MTKAERELLRITAAALGQVLVSLLKGSPFPKHLETIKLLHDGLEALNAEGNPGGKSDWM